MTKKHFIVIAKAIREGSDKASIINALAFEFAKLNPHFDATKFINACIGETK